MHSVRYYIEVTYKQIETCMVMFFLRKYCQSFIIAIFLAFFCYGCSIENSDNLFDYFWQEMDQKYPYFDEKNIDWNIIHDHYYSRTRNASTEDYIQVFQAIIDSLRDGHVSIRTQETLLSYNVFFTEIDYFYTGFGNIIYYYGIAPTDVHVNEHVNSCYSMLQLNDNIVYMQYFTSIEKFCVDTFEQLIKTYSYANGIIIDVRHNSGGKEPVNLASCFFYGVRTVRYEKHKIGKGHNDFTDYFPIQISGNGIIDEKTPVVILTNKRTYSAANFFVAEMKYLPNVTIIGTTTGGGGSPRQTSVLPNGWTYTFPYSRSYDIQYNSLERGVVPHIEIVLTEEMKQDERQTGIDPVFKVAYQYLLE
jgi:C-terminal processing protease CtpA/Prc